MKPLNYAILKHFTKVEEACTRDVMKALESEYGSFKAFNYEAVMKALMTAEANFILEESRFEFDENKKVHVYYKANEEGKKMINNYIQD